MKNKTGIFKIILCVLLAITLITWIIPAGYFNQSEFISATMNRIGFFDFFQLLFGAYEFSYFIQMAILLVSIGALYEVLNKTGKYTTLVKKIASKFKGKEKIFLLGSAFLIAVLTSAFDFGLSTFIFIPLIISVILTMKYDKITAFMTTFGAYLIGIIGSTVNNGIVQTINATLDGLTLKSAIWFKLLLFVASFAILAIYLFKAKTLTKKDADKIEDKFIGEETKTKSSLIPIIAIFGILFVILIVGCINWTGFNITIFDTLKENIEKFKVVIGGEDIFIIQIIFGNIAAFGKWFYAEMAMICILSALIIGAIYKQKCEVFTNMYEGAKKMLPSALLVMACYTVVFFAGNTMIFPTIENFILGATSKFNILFASITTLLGSAIHIDMLYLTTYVIGQIASMTNNLELVAILFQSLYGVTMFAVPTSVMLVLGLSYLDINYIEWIKKSWLFIVKLLVISLVVILLIAVI